MRRYAEKEIALRAGPSSEDVWEERSCLVGEVWQPMEEGSVAEREEVVEERPLGERRGSAKGLYTV